MQHNHLLLNPNKDAMTNFPTIGVAGITIPGAIDCINKINQQAIGKFKCHHHPNIIMHLPDFGPTHHAQRNHRWDIVENRLIQSIEILANSNADFVIIPANTVHKVIDNIKKRATIPVFSMLDMVAMERHRLNLKKVGILGTQWTMADHLYQEPLLKYNIDDVIQ